MSNARLLALILAIIISGTVILFTAAAMARTKPTKRAKSTPAPEQSAAAPAPEQPGGWIAEVKKSRPICASADDYVQFHRTSFDIAKRPSQKAMQKAIEFVQRKCPIATFEPGDHVNVERTETFFYRQNQIDHARMRCGQRWPMRTHRRGRNDVN